jgi:hypothetical protein
MDDLLGHAQAAAHPVVRTSHDHAASTSRGRDVSNWIPAEGGPLTLPSAGSHTHTRSHFANLDEEKGDDARFAIDRERKTGSSAFEGLVMREGELMSKLHDLLHSPLGSGLARIIDELHQMMPRNKNLS